MGCMHSELTQCTRKIEYYDERRKNSIKPSNEYKNYLVKKLTWKKCIVISETLDAYHLFRDLKSLGEESTKKYSSKNFENAYVYIYTKSNEI